MKQTHVNTKQSFLKSKFVVSLKKSYERFLKIRGNPHEIGLGMALGLFIGMTPTVGIQMAIAVFFAALFKWNKISAAMGVWISNPLTVIPIYTFTYQIGALILGSNGTDRFPMDFGLEAILKVPELFLIATLGGVVIGIPIAIIGYFVSYNAIKRYQDGIKKKLALQKERLKSIKQKRTGKKKRKKK